MNDYFVKPGVDIEEVSRIESLYNKWGEIFLNRVFTLGEIKYCSGKSSMLLHLTARFAAKEAVIKILKKEKSPPLNSIEILNDKNGAPHVVLHGEAEKTASIMGINKIEISLSHTRTHAVAFAIAF